MKPLTTYRTALFAALTLSCPLHAAQSTATPGEAAGILAAGLGVLVLVFIVTICFHALFIHMAARILGIGKSFGTAISAVFMNILLTIVLSLLIGMFDGGDGRRSGLIASLCAFTAAIKLSYGCGIVKAVLAAVLTWVLTWAVFLGALVLFTALLVGASAAVK